MNPALTLTLYFFGFTFFIALLIVMWPEMMKLLPPWMEDLVELTIMFLVTYGIFSLLLN